MVLTTVVRKMSDIYAILRLNISKPVEPVAIIAINMINRMKHKHSVYSDSSWLDI